MAPGAAARAGSCEGDGLTKVPGRKIRSAGDDDVVERRGGERDEMRRIVGETIHRERVHGDRPGEREEQAVVVVQVQEGRRRHHALAARSVLRDHGLPEPAGEPLGEEAHGHVWQAARR
jgi:hypothetical protein